MKCCGNTTRREFLKRSLMGSMGAMAAMELGGLPSVLGTPIDTFSRVALTSGLDRPDNIFRGLQMYKQQIAAAIGRKRVVIKPNVVIGTPDNGHGDVGLSTTHVDALEAILEFLTSIGKTDVLIAESSATDPTFVGYENIGYFNLLKKYPVKLIDLNQEGYSQTTIYAGTGSQTVRISRLLRSPDNFVISAARMKTHNNVIATLSLKNVVMASPVIDIGTFKGQTGARSDKNFMHGSSNQDLNDNLHRLAFQLAPDLAVLDGFQGMQGNGPCWGTAVDQHVAVVSLDFLAADRVGLELMGVPSQYPAYLNYCAQSGLGQFDLNKIIVEGETIAGHKITYKLYDNYQNTQLGMRATPRFTP